ncbi:hypothetical protein ES708_21002 [subsurface metagenome]
MFVGRRMKNDIRPGSFYDVVHVVPVLKFPENRNNRCSLSNPLLLKEPKLPFDLVDAVLSMSEQEQPLRSP